MELTWLGKYDEVKYESHILIEDAEKSYGDKSSGNMLIKGDNLLALKALEQEYTGKIKCIYIDPPYNTGNSFKHYDDKLKHSKWLSFMSQRLKILRNLLSEQGIIFVQIDNRELHYLKILMDEIFGRDNFRNSVIVKKGVKNVQRQFRTIEKLNAGYDSILVYSKGVDYRLPNLFAILNKEDVSGSWNNHWRGTNRPTMRYELFGIIPETGQWRWSKERTYKAVRNYEIFIDYIENRNKCILDKNNIDMYYQKYLDENEITDKKDFEIVRLSRNGKPEHYIPPSNEILLSENWTDLSVAGRQTDFEHEKNENILYRIIDWVTEPMDLILDVFLGSGTTAAVAHKMNRRWIGIELGEHCDTHCVPRLKSVIDGADQGGFKYYKVEKEE